MDQGEYYHWLAVTKLNDDYGEPNIHNTEKFKTFVHERVHFLQNFSTLFGINKSIWGMTEFLNSVKNTQNGLSPQKLDDTGILVKESYIAPYGETEVFDCVYLRNIEYDTFYKEIFPEHKDLFSESVILNYDNKRYIFGGDTINESMAYLFEKHLFDATDFDGMFPYDACSIIYEHIQGSKCNNLPVLIALAYVSLMSQSPGNTFISILENAKEQNIQFYNMASVFSFASQYIRYVTSEQIQLLYDRIDEIFPVGPATLINSISHNNLAEDLIYTNKWLKDKYTSIIYNESTYRNALIAVLECDNKKLRLLLMKELIDQYGTPIIIDINGRLYPNEEKQLVFLLAPWELQSIMLYNDDSCLLFDICTQYDCSTNDNCSTFCWKNQTTKCILGFYMHILGLNNIDFNELRNQY